MKIRIRFSLPRERDAYKFSSTDLIRTGMRENAMCCVRVCVHVCEWEREWDTYSSDWRLRGRCSTAGYNLSAATSSPCSQLITTTATEDHHFEWGSQPRGQRHGHRHNQIRVQTLQLTWPINMSLEALLKMTDVWLTGDGGHVGADSEGLCGSSCSIRGTVQQLQVLQGIWVLAVAQHNSNTYMYIWAHNGFQIH